MKTTKNVTIRENNTGFVVRNNNTTICTKRSYAEAEAEAIAIAKAENKNVVVDTDYYHTVIR